MEKISYCRRHRTNYEDLPCYNKLSMIHVANDELICKEYFSNTNKNNTCAMKA